MAFDVIDGLGFFVFFRLVLHLLLNLSGLHICKDEGFAILSESNSFPKNVHVNTHTQQTNVTPFIWKLSSCH